MGNKKRKRNKASNQSPSQTLGLEPSDRNIQPPKSLPHSRNVTREGAAAARRFAPGWLRVRVLRRDGYRCKRCRALVTVKTANIDHIQPWPWGLTEYRNLQTLCTDCNRTKGSQHPENMKRRHPIRIINSGSMGS